MEMKNINLFVKLKTTKPIKLIQDKTKIRETLTPTNSEAKLINRLIQKNNKKLTLKTT